MSWSDWIVSKADWLLHRYVPAEKDITYQCIPVDLFLALLPTIVAYAVVGVHRLQWWWWRRRRHERAAAVPGRRRGAEFEERARREEKERRWLGRSARATEAALASLGLFAAGVAALQSERVCALNANAHCLAYLVYRACHTLWGLARAYDYIAPDTAADSPLRRWLASPACGAALAALAAAQVMAMFYEAAAGRKRFETSTRNIWFTEF